MCRDASKKREFTSKADAKRYVRAHKRTPSFTATRVYFCESCQCWRITSRKQREVRWPSKSPDELDALARHILATNPTWTALQAYERAAKRA